jgi:hypothetical protein
MDGLPVVELVNTEAQARMRLIGWAQRLRWKTCGRFAAIGSKHCWGTARARSAFGSMTNIESASAGKRKDQRMSKSPTTTKGGKKLPPIL